MKCDFLQAEGTCNNEHGDPSGRCFTHRNMPGLTLRDLFTKLEACGLREESERAKYEAALTRGRAKIAALIAERVDIQAALTGPGSQGRGGRDRLGNHRQRLRRRLEQGVT